MNTVRSVWLGWGTLMVAGGAAYYFAKKDINAHRREQELKGTRGTEFLECTSPLPLLVTRRLDFQCRRLAGGAIALDRFRMLC
jgi:hypothetical protein